MKRSSFVLVLLIFWSVLSKSQNPSNFAACKYRYATCNSSLLTPEEQAQVAAAARARNLSACKYGYVSCDSSQLTPEEQTQVAVAARARNLSACKYGYSSCNLSLLTAAESAQISAGRTVAPIAESQVSPAGVAENGSYYGELNANGVPKTVHVNGYYRKDGTYVRGHYRSAPGTNPSGSRGHR